ncbi:M3 family metallopeptidase [Chitinimonas viridis]|uniref:M3 family metallopeptidase n=1 Tax=Chitinimonas viridis TaxID=664880 RepID=A0ABT8B2B1_9NEIS|nr:M3 family metallopeptidase [Chitinimonas viridis]MDN3576150.1 M3 family metallopeptidase [Chitinimonas viridis]
MENARLFFEQLNRDYLNVHKSKEDLFWTTYMATSDDHAGFAQAEMAYKSFISDPDRLLATRQHLAAVEQAPASAARDALLHGLQGWVALFESNIVDNDQARELMQQLVEAESTLFSRRKALVLKHINEQGMEEEATLSSLATNMSLNPVEARRQSSFAAFRGLEEWVLANGFLDIVKLRNRFAQALGYRDYFDYKVRKNEQMSSETLFNILDDFVARTETANARALVELKAAKGETALAPWNLRFHMSGDVVRQMDPYLPFGRGLLRWVESFRRLGIRYRGATLQLDLLDRKGKYQNGFCHGPIPTYYNEQGQWVAGQINFTAEAKPDQVGSGWRALTTLFHEGGHAAHFANVAQNSPCFSQEFAPTSMAYAETQSMFCDSLLDDADWLKRYARNAAGEAMPDALIHARIECNQPFRAFSERSIAVVSYFESALYQLDDASLTAETVLALARSTEQRILGVEGPRPLLAIPHLLNQESAAAYHGYLLANMAVYQTRAYFLNRYGYLTDNPAIGPLLTQHYWVPGNSINHNATLLSLTGEGFSARYLADDCNMTVAEAWTQAQATMAAAAERQYPQDYPDNLDAHIRIVHGAEVLADSSESEAAMCQQFERWVGEHYAAPVH